MAFAVPDSSRLPFVASALPIAAACNKNCRRVPGSRQECSSKHAGGPFALESTARPGIRLGGEQRFVRRGVMRPPQPQPHETYSGGALRRSLAACVWGRRCDTPTQTGRDEAAQPSRSAEATRAMRRCCRISPTRGPLAQRDYGPASFRQLPRWPKDTRCKKRSREERAKGRPAGSVARRISPTPLLPHSPTSLFPWPLPLHIPAVHPQPGLQLLEHAGVGIA